MSDLFARPQRPQPVEHYCLLCERPASFGVRLRRRPEREGGPRPGDGYAACAWYCREHAHVGRALLRQEKGLA